MAKLKFRAPIISSIGNMPLSVGKLLQLGAPPSFLTHDAAVVNYCKL